MNWSFFILFAISFLHICIIDCILSGSPPVITEHPLDILVAKGDPATLRCETSGENVEVSWYKDSELVKVGNGHRLLLPNGSLFLLKINNGGTDSDAGTYYCIAKNEFGEVRSQEANVRVAMLREDFRQNPQSIQALIGNRVVLECSPPKGFPEPIVTWKKDEKELNLHENTKYQSFDGNLVIENAQRSDSGFYQCVATNMVGERISKPARLSVYEKPKFMVEPKNVIVEINSSVLFECRVAGEPMPSISWKKIDSQMPVGRAYVARDRGGLRIDRVQPDDAGEYVCYAKNPVGSVESSARLIVNSPPVFTKFPQNLRLNTGKTAVFECEAIGQPTPGIFWSKEGDQLFTFFSGLVSSDGRIQVSKEGRLIIDNVQQYDKGNYVCAAVNSAGSTLAKASLGIINDATSSYPPPIIQYGHQNQTLMLNDIAIMPCQTTGRVAVKINWLKNGLEMDFNASDYKGRYRQLPVGTLQIADLRKEDTGIYTCRARNEDGEATWTASLVVEEHTNQDIIFQRMPDAAALPSPPGQPKVLNVSEESIELEWTAPERQGASPIIGYIIQYWSPQMGETWQNILDVITKTRFRIRHLRPGHSYVFLIRAENAKGIGLPSTPSEMISTKGSANLELEEQEHRMSRMLDVETARQRLASEQLIKLLEVRPLNATAMLLTWKQQRKEPLVEGYYIKWRGPPLAHDHSWVNITDPGIDYIIINGLRPFNNYEFFVIPYHQQIQGMPSNSLDGTTAETPPTMPPSEVRLRMLNISSLRVSWRPPPQDHINGILKGFLINIRSNHSSVEDRNITTNERATSVTLYRLIPNASYAIKIAARTNAGVGVFYIGEPIVMNEETLHNHVRLFERSNSEWYRQPWTVLGSGIAIWCLLLTIIVFIWYRCCNCGKTSSDEKKEKEFIKIRDGSVPNTTVLGEARNAFWNAHEQFNGGTVETFSGTLARTNAHQNIGHHQASNYSTECGSSCCNGGNVLVNSMGMIEMKQPHGIHCSATLQRINGDCNNPHVEHAHSPTHHYHYAQLPPEHFGNSADPSSLSTFLPQSHNPHYYDDPSPYATTTLVNPGATLRTSRNHQGPALPLQPAPKNPPSHFLSVRAVVRNSGIAAEQQNCCHAEMNSNSCSALLELDPSEQRRVTASTLQQRKNRNKGSRQQQFGTAGRTSGISSKKNGGGRSSSVSAAQTNRQQQFRNYKGCQEESPQTDISYIHSSDGGGGGSMNLYNPPNISTTFAVEAPEYDPVMTESMNQRLQENIRKIKGRERANWKNARNRVSMIEDEDQAEQDPLIDDNNGNGREEDESEADAEMSDEYISSAGGSRGKRRGRQQQGIEKEHYYAFTPPTNKPSRQPMMGVNISTLSVGDAFHGSAGLAEHTN